MTLIEHFEELRTRLFIALSAWVIGMGVAFAFRTDILTWLRAPLPAELPLIANRLLEQFMVSMQVAAFFGLVLAAPIIVGQVWGFIAPGLYPEERRWAVPFVLLTALAFVAGILFAYYVALPFALPILTGFLTGEVVLLLNIGDYISKILAYMAVFGLIFEMPVVSFLLARLGLLRVEFLRVYRRYAIVISFIAAALITPTADPINLLLVALPLVILYEVSILVVRISQRKVPFARDDSELTRSH